MQDCYKKDISIDSNTLLHDNVKQKEGEGSKTEKSDDRKGWFHNFRKSFGLKSVRITQETSSADQEVADSSQMPFRKSLRREDICLNQVLMQIKVPFSREKNCHKGYLLVGKGSKHQDLSQE